MDIKSFLKLDNIYGKKLVLILYYVAVVFAVVGMFVGIVGGITTMVQGGILAGLWKLITSPFMLAFQLIVIRVVCELLTVLFAKHDA